MRWPPAAHGGIVARLRRTGPLTAYLHFARCAFQRRAAYRLANWTGFAVNFFFFLVHAQVLRAFFSTRPGAEGWSPEDAVVYFAGSEALLMVVTAFPDWRYNIAYRIRDGSIASDLARPVDLFWRDFAERYGTALYYLTTRAPAIYVAGLLVYGVAPPLRPELAWFPVSLALGVGVSACFWYVAGVSAYWTEHARGPLAVTTWLFTIAGGMVVPLDFYPLWLQWLCDALPFRAALYTPVALLTGRLAGDALTFGLVHQVVWLGLLIAGARALGARGEGRLVAQGG